MGLGTKLKEALNGDRDRKDTRYNSAESPDQHAPGAYPDDDHVPRSHHGSSTNDQWYASESASHYNNNNDTYDLNEAVPEDPDYTYNNQHRGFDGEDASVFGNEDDFSNNHNTNDQGFSSHGAHNRGAAKGMGHRKSLSKDSTRREEKNLPATPYWGNSPTTSQKQHSNRGTLDPKYNNNNSSNINNNTNGVGARDTLVPRDEPHNRNIPTGRNDIYDLYNADGSHEQHQGRPRDERRSKLPLVQGGHHAGNRNDTFDMYNSDGTHERLQDRPRDERRAMMNGTGNPRGAYPTSNGGEPDTYNLTDRSRSSRSSGSGFGTKQSSENGIGMGVRSGMGNDHFGPGHSGARVLHRCDHCGNDNDISRYFRKDAAYRME